MIHIFNRRELIVLFSDQQQYGIRTALQSAGIPYYIKFNDGSFASAGRNHGRPFVNQDAAHPCIIYVRKGDYDRAKIAIQSVL